MTTKSKARSSISEATHEVDQDLYALGFINKRKMQKYNAFDIQPVPQYDQKKIRDLRDRYQLSQSVLATVLNTSLSTVCQWEIGDKHPSGPSLKLLNLLDRKGLEALI